MRHSPRIPSLALLAGLPSLALLTPSPGTALAALTGAASRPSSGSTSRGGGSTSWGGWWDSFGAAGSGGADPTAPLLAVVALAVWACTAWLALLVLLTCLGRLPGAVGRTGQALSRRLAPAAVRTFVQVATGLTVAGTVLAGPVLSGSSAFAAEPAPPLAPVSDLAAGQDLSLDWPLTSPVAATPPPATSAGPADQDLVGTRRDPSPAGVGAPSAVPDASGVVVQAGDSLWDIAADALGPQASAARVAQAWPQWWQANRAVVGEDPDLIHPGTALVRPALTDPTR